MQQWGKEAGGSRASCVVTCSAVNPMSKSTPVFQLVHPSMTCYSVSLSDISGTKSNTLKITISYHLLLWIYIILSSNYWLTQSLAMEKVSFEVTQAKIQTRMRVFDKMSTSEGCSLVSNDIASSLVSCANCHNLWTGVSARWIAFVTQSNGSNLDWNKLKVQ